VGRSSAHECLVPASDSYAMIQKIVTERVADQQ
jgi:hypothetical protein